MSELIKVRRKFSILILVATVGLLICAVFSLYQFRQNLLHDRRIQLRMQVEMALGISEHFYSRFRAGEMSEEAARQEALATIRTLRYGRGGHFWITNSSARMVMHPINSELSGKDMSEVMDVDGKLIFKEFVKESSTPDGGFVDYRWSTADRALPEVKIAYVKLFRPWGWVIGSDSYLDDVEDKFNRLAQVLFALIAIGVVLLAWVSWGRITVCREVKEPCR